MHVIQATLLFMCYSIQFERTFLFSLSVISRNIVVCNFPSAKSQQSDFIKMFQRELNAAIARVHNEKLITAAVQLNCKMGYILYKCSGLLRVLCKYRLLGPDYIMCVCVYVDWKCETKCEQMSSLLFFINEVCWTTLASMWVICEITVLYRSIQSWRT